MEIVVGALFLGIAVWAFIIFGAKKSTDLVPNEKLKKFEFSSEDFLDIDGKRLYRIVALQDFADVRIGDKGGYLESEKNLSNAGKCWVSGDAKVYENATIIGNAQIRDNASIYGDAVATQDAQVYGNAKIRDKAVISESAKIFGTAEVFGAAEVFGNASVYGSAQVYENAKIFGNAKVQMNTQIYGSAKIAFGAKIMGDAKVGGESKIENRTILSSTHE